MIYKISIKISHRLDAKGLIMLKWKRRKIIYTRAKTKVKRHWKLWKSCSRQRKGVIIIPKNFHFMRYINIMITIFFLNFLGYRNQAIRTGECKPRRGTRKALSGFLEISRPSLLTVAKTILLFQILPSSNPPSPLFSLCHLCTL